MYLLDTPVIAELRRAKSGLADEHVTRWASNVPAQNLFVSVLSLLELESGIAEVQRKDRALGAALHTWIDVTVPAAFEGRILSVDLAVTKKRATLPFSETKDRDALLAATALTHGLTVVTRNLSSYRFSKVKLFNPWGYTPDEDDLEADWQDVSRSGPLWLKNLFLRF